MNCYKKIGIIGGMGPESTALLYQQIVRSFQERFGAYKDEDFPEILIHNLPIPNIIVDVKQQEQVRKMLSRSVHFLVKSGSELIAFPCNSLNYFVDYLISQTDIPLVSIVDETCKTIRQRNSSEILLLSTPTTFEKGLYQRYLKDVRIKRPKEYAKILDLIIRTLKGEYPKREFIELMETEFPLYNCIVIGCTDLSILIQDYQDERLVDSMRCLVNGIIERVDK